MIRPGTDEGDGGTSSSGTGGGGPRAPTTTELCDKICTAGAEAKCQGIELGDCLSSCYEFVAITDHAAQCSSAAYAYLTCVNGLTNICDLADDSICSGADVAKCAVAYCQAHPGALECTSVSGPAE